MMPRSDSERQRSMDPPQETVIAHMVPGEIRDGATLTALCGETLTIDLDENREITGSGQYIVCALCEAAWQLADQPIPRPEQGTLW